MTHRYRTHPLSYLSSYTSPTISRYRPTLFSVLLSYEPSGILLCSLQRCPTLASHIPLRLKPYAPATRCPVSTSASFQVVRNCSANGAKYAETWAGEEKLLEAMIRCLSASEHIKACVVGAVFAMSRAGVAAQTLLKGGLVKMLEARIKEKVRLDSPVDLRSFVGDAASALVLTPQKKQKSTSTAC